MVFAPAGRLTDDLDTWDLDFQHRFAVGERHRVVWGFGYRFTRDSLGNSPALAFLPARLDQELYSGFLQDEIRLRENLTFTLGSKVEHNDYTGVEAEPGIRLQWNPTATQGIWAAISRAVRAPSRIDLDVSQPAPPYLVVLKGGAGFVSETVTAYEAGWRVHFAERASASVAVFYNRYADVRSTSLTPGTILPFFFENNLEGETHGLEFAGSYQVSDAWRLSATYDLLEEHLHVKPGKFDLNNALNETSDPRHQFSVRSSLNVSPRIELDAGLRWVGALTANNAGTPGTVPSYVSLDVRIGWHPSPRFEFSLVGQNLLDQSHPEYGFPSPTLEEIERGVFAKAVWRY